MEMLKRLIVVTLLFCLAGAVVWKTYGSNEPSQNTSQKWEYVAVFLPIAPGNGKAEEKELNKAGANGWELVNATMEERERKIGSKTTIIRGHFFCFKRPK